MPALARNALILGLALAVFSGCGDDARPAAVSAGGAVTEAAGGDCSQDSLSGGDDEFAFGSAYRVVDGRLDSLCFGVDDRVVRSAWDELAAISPPSQLGDLAVFGGFAPDGADAADTLAFVSILDVDGSQFQMAINTVDAQADPDELRLTLAHEFSHVFTATSTQLDRSDESIEACSTYFNGEGGFFGPYAATNPEEDFAEAFSAFVFGLEPATNGQAERLDWIAAQPGLLEFRARADAAKLTPMENRFELCGP